MRKVKGSLNEFMASRKMSRNNWQSSLRGVTHHHLRYRWEKVNTVFTILLIAQEYVNVSINSAHSLAIDPQYPVFHIRSEKVHYN